MEGVSMETIVVGVLAAAFFLTIGYVAMWRPKGASAQPEPEGE